MRTLASAGPPALARVHSHPVFVGPGPKFKILLFGRSAPGFARWMAAVVAGGVHVAPARCQGAVDTKGDMMTSYVTQRNGDPASADELAPLAFAGYAHFTAAQVRGRRIRGLDLHLERLRVASLKLFGRALPDEQVLNYLRTAIASGPADLSLMATMYSSAGELTNAGLDAYPDVLVRTGPPAAGPSGPLALATVEHERMVPTVKHVGEIAKTYYLRQAIADGFDDAAFVDGKGRLSEASIWNLAFWDGEGVVWPRAEMLVGVTMGIVRRQLENLGVRQREREITHADLPMLSGAAVMNSWTPGVAVDRIDEVSLPEAPTFLELLHRAYQAESFTAP